MANKTVRKEIVFNSWYDILFLLSVNLNQAIKCCAIVEAFDVLKVRGCRLVDNILAEEMINCTFRDLLISTCRIFDETKNSKCNVKKLKECINKDSIISKEEKRRIIDKLKQLQKEYDNLYKNDRDRRLAHSNYEYILLNNESGYEYKQIRDFIVRTSEVFKYIMSINNDSIPILNIQDLKTEYLSFVGSGI